MRKLYGRTFNNKLRQTLVKNGQLTQGIKQRVILQRNFIIGWGPKNFDLFDLWTLSAGRSQLNCSFKLVHRKILQSLRIGVFIPRIAFELSPIKKVVVITNGRLTFQFEDRITGRDYAGYQTDIWKLQSLNMMNLDLDSFSPTYISVKILDIDNDLVDDVEIEIDSMVFTIPINVLTPGTTNLPPIEDHN